MDGGDGMKTKSYYIPQNEDLEQAALISWAELYESVYPELALLYHIPNGGKRDRAVAAKLKAQGVKPGVPDLCLPVPRGKYHGLYIEMKDGKNKTTDDQDKWLAALSAQGYAVKVCYGCAAARKSIEKYLNLK